MKSIIPYVGTDNFVRAEMNLIGSVGTPNKNGNVITEAVVVEAQKFLNIVYENYDANTLTESQAMHLTSMVERSEDLVDIAVDYIDFCESTGNDLDVDGINISVFGEKVMPLKTIVESFSRDSIYTIPDKGKCTWDKTTAVGSFMESAMKTIYNEKAKYESNQYSMFDAYESVGSLNEVPALKDLMCECINAEAVKGVITLEDAAIEKGFVLNAFNEFEIGAMAPVVPLTGSEPQENIKDISILDLNRKDDAEINQDQKDNKQLIEIDPDVALEYATESMMETGFYSFFEAAVPKNNLGFDNECRKLFSKILKCLKLSNPEDENASFKAMLNVNKTTYNFTFIENPPMQEDQIRSVLLLLKWIPNKLNNQIVDYSKDLGNLKLKLEFPDMQTGIKISYSAPIAPAAPATTTEAFLDSIQTLRDNKDANPKDTLNVWYEYVAGADPEDLAPKFEQMDVVCDTMNHFIESAIPTQTSEISCINSADTMEYLITELTSDVNDSFRGYIIDALESVAIPSKFVDYDAFGPIYEHTLESRYACQVVLNSIEMMEADEEDIDEDIKPTIDLLNRLGYKTKYSCSGHYKSRIEEDGKRDGVYRGKLYTTARITFDKKYDFAQIPKGWYQNPNADVTSIYVEPLRYNEKNGAPDEAFKKWKDGYMTSLKAWAENLDKSSSHNVEESFDELKNSIDQFSQFIMESGKPKQKSIEDELSAFAESLL